MFTSHILCGLKKHMKREGGGVEGSRVELTKNKLILC